MRKIIHSALIMRLLGSCTYRTPNSNEGELGLSSILAPGLDYAIDQHNKEMAIKRAMDTGNVLPDGTPCKTRKIQQEWGDNTVHYACRNVDGQWRQYP